VSTILAASQKKMANSATFFSSQLLHVALLQSHLQHSNHDVRQEYSIRQQTVLIGVLGLNNEFVAGLLSFAVIYCDCICFRASTIVLPLQFK